MTELYIPDLEQAHDIYHSQCEETPLEVERRIELLDTLRTSENADHLIDAAWIALDLVEDCRTSDIENAWEGKGQMLEIAQDCLDTAETIGTKKEQLQARFIAAYVPTYGEHFSGQEIDRDGLVARLGAVNESVIDAHTQSPGAELRGLANEVALALLICGCTIENLKSQVIAWPASSWQDRHSSNGRLDFTAAKGRNYDINIGEFPLKIIKAQVKSSLDQGKLQSLLHTDNGDDILEYWRGRYENLVCLIFADVHLARLKQDLIRTNRLLASPIENRHELQRMFSNVIEEVVTHGERIHLNWLARTQKTIGKLLVGVKN